MSENGERVTISGEGADRRAVVKIRSGLEASIVRPHDRLQDELEVAPIITRGGKVVVGEPTRLEATSGDLDEVADTIARGAKKGLSLGRILKILSEGPKT